MDLYLRLAIRRASGLGVFAIAAALCALGALLAYRYSSSALVVALAIASVALLALALANNNARGGGPGALSSDFSAFCIAVMALAPLLGRAGSSEPSGIMPFAGAMLLVLGCLIPAIQRTCARALPFAAHVPGLRMRNSAWFDRRWAYLAVAAASSATLVGSTFGWHPLICFFLAVGSWVLMTMVAFDAVQRIVQRIRAKGNVAQLARNLSPRFALYWDAPKDTGYQIGMWLPLLESVDEPYIVVTRTPVAFAQASAQSDRPTFMLPRETNLDEIITPSLRAAFYVNNAGRNGSFVRYTALTHVQLNHGESDKAPSFNKQHRAYDQNWVAGQASIDRFAQNGVETRDDFFRIIGRPQLADLRVGPRDRATDGPRVLLYAPTWKGYTTDADFSSLAEAPRIVELLLEFNLTIIFRPHPYYSRDPRHVQAVRRARRLLSEDRSKTGKGHLFGEEAETRLSIFECFEQSDLLLSDVSSVVADFLYTERPFATVMTRGETVEKFQREFQLARAGYVLRYDSLGTSEASAVLREMLEDDPMRDRRVSLKQYYLSELEGSKLKSNFESLVDTAIKRISSGSEQAGFGAGPQ